MKYNFHIILLCLAGIAFSIGCEKADLQKSTLNTEPQIQSREIIECSECPMGDCCCAVWLQDPVFGYANLYICGSSYGLGNWSVDAVGGCPPITGGGQGLELVGGGTFRRGFCVDPGDAFWVYNLEDEDADVYITCEYDETFPQTLQLTIPANSRVYIGSNGACEIEECN